MMTGQPKRLNPPLLEMREIDKSFPGVQALKNVSMELRRGEVLGLVGENGAGKSTLIKILGGAHLPDSGSIVIDGRPAEIVSPTAAHEAGVSIIYQEFNLVADLTVQENIFLGREETRMGFIRGGQEHRATLELFEKIGIDIDPKARCRELTVAQQQTVEIAKALSVNAKIIVMDEPTATLTSREVGRLFAVIRDLKSHGLGIIYISHRFEEVFEVADRVMVLRDAEHVGTEDIGDITREKLIEMTVGRPIESEFPKRTSRPGRVRLRAEGLRRGDVVRDVSFSVRAGEILGFAGLVGAGRTETMRLIFGADKRDGGRIFIDGKEAGIRSPKDAIRKRICLLAEDRKGHGLVLIHSCRENFGLPNLDRFRRGAFVDRRKERARFSHFVERLRIKVAGHEQLVMNLSGGNQQKVVLAKWLERNADIIIFDEPTRGIDVGTKYEIYVLINRLLGEGKAIIMISSELPEVLGMSDRVIVMHEGRVKGEISDVARATQEEILSMAIS
ncbi:MAG: sugar ABC transporter ATP-binding protein [Phycisphaerales bacterium]|nr:MAG: sugar ABC transporter ATP-binding protein [Phycisphaerales bacterium]